MAPSIGKLIQSSAKSLHFHVVNWWHWSINSPGLWPRACQITSNVLLTLILYIVSNLFLKYLQLKSTQTAISNNFSNKTEETNSNNISRSNNCFLFEKCAREATSLGAPGHVQREVFSCWGVPFFKAIFGINFLWKNVPDGPPNSINNLRTSDTTWHLKRSQQNMLKMW